MGPALRDSCVMVRTIPHATPVGGDDRGDGRVSEAVAPPQGHQRARLRQLHVIDCTLTELETALENAEIIEERELDDGTSKELLLVVDWKRPLHIVVVVDDVRREERIVTVYEPLAGQWTADYRRRR